MARLLLWPLVAEILAAGCASATPGPRDAVQASQPAPPRTLVMAIRVEPETLASKALLATAGTTTTVQKRLFNAGLARGDDQDRLLPYLAEDLPQLNTPSWLVFPDGGMETTYRLRPGLTWHDGTTLSAEDFVFAWRVYGDADFPTAGTSPLNRMAQVTTPDQGTVVIRWRQPFPNAGVLAASDFPPLPRHLLEEPFERAGGELPTHPFWSHDYIGVGPYRLDKWEPGTFIEASDFQGHVLGRPKIERLRLLFMADQNAVLAGLLSEAVHIAVDSSIRIEQTATLEQRWAASGGQQTGSVIVFPANWRFTQVQRRPEYLNPPALLDLRVRRALAHTIDKAALTDALYGSAGMGADTLIALTVAYFPQVDQAITKYPYDVRRSEQLMVEAGFAKGIDGFYVSPTEGRFTAELMVQTSVQSEREMAIMTSGWRQVGFDFQERVLPAALIRDNEARSTFRALATTGGPHGERGLLSYTTGRIPGPQNRWSGTNRGAWSNSDFDRLADAFEVTLDTSERTRQVIGMAKLLSDELGVLPLLFDVQPIPYIAPLRGPGPFATDVSWNVHEWYWAS